MKIGLIEFDPVWKDPQENLRRVVPWLEGAQQQGCQLAVLPEMFATGFVVEPDYPLESADGPTSQLLQKLAGELEMGIIAGIACVDPDAQRRNCAMYFDHQGKLGASYAKMKPFTGANEQLSVMAGDRPMVFDCDGMQAALFICYDLRFPELFRELRVLTECVFVVANWPSVRTNHWLTLLKARAIENQCFVIGVNRTGTDGNGWQYDGHSAVYAPDGSAVPLRLAEGPLTTCELDREQVASCRRQFPVVFDT